MTSLDREICGSTMVARTGTELAVDGIEESPDKEAKFEIIISDMSNIHVSCFDNTNEET